MARWRPGPPGTHIQATIITSTDRIVATLTIFTSAPPFWWMVRLGTTSYRKPPDRQGYADTLDDAKRAAEAALAELVKRL